jgi:hypothetical protein
MIFVKLPHLTKKSLIILVIGFPPGFSKQSVLDTRFQLAAVRLAAGASAEAEFSLVIPLREEVIHVQEVPRMIAARADDLLDCADPLYGSHQNASENLNMPIVFGACSEEILFTGRVLSTR